MDLETANPKVPTKTIVESYPYKPMRANGSPSQQETLQPTTDVMRPPTEAREVEYPNTADDVQLNSHASIPPESTLPTILPIKQCQ